MQYYHFKYYNIVHRNQYSGYLCDLGMGFFDELNVYTKIS